MIIWLVKSLSSSFAPHSAGNMDTSSSDPLPPNLWIVNHIHFNPHYFTINPTESHEIPSNPIKFLLNPTKPV